MSTFVLFTPNINIIIPEFVFKIIGEMNKEKSFHLLIYVITLRNVDGVVHRSPLMPEIMHGRAPEVFLHH